MKIYNKNLNVIAAAALAIFFLFSVSSCSDDEEDRKATFSHSHGDEVTDLEKHKFEHQFADQCVAREIKKSANKDYDARRFNKSCMCIARFMLEDLTAIEAEKFLEEKKNTRSLQIRYENAAYNCLQKGTQPKPPQIFKHR